jgi:chorismate mutase
MAAIGDSDQRTLADLRAKIDRIDEAMHRLLIERGTVIDALIGAKRTLGKRAPFRPQREAEMMRRLAARHRGSLPLATVEHLWREIISTFTFMQSPFRLIVDYGTDPAAMHDLARFAFGFSVELVAADGPADVVARVGASGADLGLIPRPSGRSESAWWRGLSAEGGPRLMALLPFIAPKGDIAATPAFVVSPALAEPSPPDLLVVAASGTADAARAARDVIVLADAGSGAKRELMLAVGPGMDSSALARLGLGDIAPIGGIARGIALDGRADLLRAAGSPA